MCPRTAQQFEEIRENRKQLIMQAALELFAREGYHSCSVARIAEYAGISKGLLYNYFTSKEDLLDSILTLGTAKFHDILEEIIRHTLDTPEELMIYIHGGFEIIRREPEFYRLLFNVFFQPGVVTSSRSQYRQMVDHLTRDIALYFETKGDPDAIDKAILLSSTIDGVGMHYFLAPDTVDLDKIEKIIFELFK
ncbi:MAG: TetR/AcrR family transcriptional regulator [Bacteroidales bacterium]|nr:TetR/AcrR family transcriptional regulator [Bacteroidales bacterium]